MKGWLEEDILRFLPESKGQRASDMRIIKWTFSLESKDRLDLEVFHVVSKPREGR